MIKTRTCSVCKKTKQLTYFVKNKPSKDGRLNKCKDCHNKHNKKQKQKHPWLITYYGVDFRCRPGRKYFLKGIRNFLTKEEIKYLWFRDKAYLLKQPSIDRIDASGHYILNNCRFIEKDINSGLKRSNKINYEIAEQIRKERANGERVNVLAKRYGIKRDFVRTVVNHTWYKTNPNVLLKEAKDE